MARKGETRRGENGQDEQEIARTVAQEEPGEPIPVPTGPTTTDGPSALGCEVVELQVEEIMPDPLNPNEQTADRFNTLVSTIAEDGFDQPIVVCPITDRDRAQLNAPPEKKYVIAKGEHRWRSMRVLGKAVIPAVVRPWDDLTRRTRMVRDNVVKGDLNKERMTELVHSLQSQHRLDADLTASLVGFDTTREMFKHMVHEKAAKQAAEEQAHLDRTKDSLKVLDDLSLLLNAIFTKHGHSVPYGYLAFMFGGQIHVMVEMQEELREQIELLGKVALERKVDINLLLAAMLREALPTYLPAWMKPETEDVSRTVPPASDGNTAQSVAGLARSEE